MSHELLKSGLKDIYDAEKRIEEALSELADEAQHEGAREAFTQHRQETQGQIERLEQAFELMEESPEREDCTAVKGMIEEHDRFKQEHSPEQEVLDLFDLMSGQKVEHYEIAAYGNLAKLASQMEMDEVGDLLHENLEEEEKTLERLTELTNDYDFSKLKQAA